MPVTVTAPQTLMDKVSADQATSLSKLASQIADKDAAVESAKAASDDARQAVVDTTADRTDLINQLLKIAGDQTTVIVLNDRAILISDGRVEVVLNVVTAA